MIYEEQEPEVARIQNGKITAEINEYGRIRFWNDKGETVLNEYYRASSHGYGFEGEQDNAFSLKHIARKYRSAGGDNYF